MSLLRLIGLAFFVAGVVFFILGITTYNTSEQVVEAVSGKPTYTTEWYIVGGILLIVLGGGLCMMKKNR